MKSTFPPIIVGLINQIPFFIIIPSAAAETKRIELIEANSQFNVQNNLAYYNQQILFDRYGQFVDSPVTGEQLRKYYEDYRTNPAYLKANPDDEKSWEECKSFRRSRS